MQSAAPPAHAWAGAAAGCDLQGRGSGCPPPAASTPPGTFKEASYNLLEGASARSRPVGGCSSARSTDRPHPSYLQGALQPAATVPAALLNSRKGAAAPIQQSGAFAAAQAPPAAPCARGAPRLARGNPQALSTAGNCSIWVGLWVHSTASGWCVWAPAVRGQQAALLGGAVGCPAGPGRRLLVTWAPRGPHGATRLERTQ